MKKLSILHFSTADREGGSARSAYRIHSQLRARGHTSRMLVGRKTSADRDVDTVFGSLLGKWADAFVESITRKFGWQYWYVPSMRRVLSHPWTAQPDIIQLFNTHGCYFSHRILPLLSRRAPIFWRLSDMWPVTPHAAYTYGCECYRKGVEACVCKLEYYPPIGRDTRRRLWEMKKKIYAQCDITVMAPSSWMYEIAKKSILFGRFPVHHIPNGIDTALFRPISKKESRARLKIDSRSRVVLFVAHGLDNNPRKGCEFVSQAIEALQDRQNLLILLAGAGGDAIASSCRAKTRLLGFVKDPDELARAYSSADVVIAPSRVENLPNTVIESLACGTPVVAFDVGGMKDGVRHMETGYLAQAYDSGDLAKGIEIILADEKLRARLSDGARKLAEKEFKQELEAQRIEKLYYDKLV